MEYKPSFIDWLDVDYISHHGIKGMHWGIRRYQNPDGSLTDQGRKRYNKTYKDTYEHLSAYKLFNGRARTVARKNAMDASDDLFRSISSTPERREIDRLEAIPYDKKLRDEYFKDHTKQDYYNEKELAYAKNWQANRRIAQHILDKYADQTMKDLKIKDKPGARDAVKQILKDKNMYATDIYNYNNPPNFKVNLTDRYELMKADHPNLSYDKIYKEMGADMYIEDNDYYKKIEDAYYRK